METIFYYVKTGKILSKDEVSALMSGYAAPTGTIGIVNKSQRVQITDGVIQNVSDIKETSSIMSQDSVLDVFTEIVNKHSQDVKRGISPRSEIRKDELDRMIREVSDRIERQKNHQKEKELEKRVFTFPNSALKKTFKLSPYFYINSFENVDCNRALFEIFPRIDMKKVDEIIDNTPYISDVRKNFYKIILSKRYEMILKPAYELLRKNKFLLEI